MNFDGKIYRLFATTDPTKFYVGSTIEKLLCKRKAKHHEKSKRYPNRKVYKHLLNCGWDNVNIELIEKCPCATKKELLERERYYVEKLKPTLNVYIPARSAQERTKAYREKNKDKIKAYMKEYNKKYYQKRKIAKA